jgi:5,10-methylenetetrahydrofolate reductase
MKFIGNKYGNEFEIFGAWYPEKHQENKQLSMEVEIEKNFKNKTKNGCKKFISQCFFDNQEFLSVTKKINNSYQGIDLYAGIFPLLKTKQLENIQKLSGCSIPNSVTEFFKTNSEQPEAIYEFGIKNTIKQVQDLLKHDFTNIHIFTMNDEQSIVEIMKEFKNV